ncbi:hypothetical protein FRB97_000933 [Tulasnella sp. 331]|nr:hypothetical protein FRB97_000933 [Tulasnella sp. 331]
MSTSHRVGVSRIDIEMCMTLIASCFDLDCLNHPASTSSSDLAALDLNLFSMMHLFPFAAAIIVPYTVGVVSQNSTCTTSLTTTCLEAAAQAGGCSGITDFTCLCNSALAIQGATACFQTNCPDAVATGLGYVQTLCAKFTSVTTAITTATATVTASAGTMSMTTSGNTALVSPVSNGAPNTGPLGFIIFLAVVLALEISSLGV